MVPFGKMLIYGVTGLSETTSEMHWINCMDLIIYIAPAAPFTGAEN